MLRRLISLFLALMLLLSSASAAFAEVQMEGNIAMDDDVIVEYGLDYYSEEEVALYLHAFAQLPPNFITKDEAQDMGWDSRRGNLWDVAYGLCIGGDTFGNREGLLPKKKGRSYYECDVNYDGGHRGAERVVFSEDGLIYYTGDHYESFDLMYEGFFSEDAYYITWQDYEAGKADFWFYPDESTEGYSDDGLGSWLDWLLPGGEEDYGW